MYEIECMDVGLQGGRSWPVNRYFSGLERKIRCVFEGIALVSGEVETVKIRCYNCGIEGRGGGAQMRVPMKVDYGVRALVEMAAHHGDGPVHTSDIATRQGIPEAYLDQLLTTLHKFGFIKSRRGPLGGHTLAKDPSEINLGMVMATLEGSTPALDCLTDPTECMLSYNCAQRDVWRSVEEAVQELLSATTLSDLAHRQYRAAGRGMYQI